MREPKISAVREALDITEGAMLMVDAVELAALPEVRIHGLPPGYVGRRVRSDCVLVGVDHFLGCAALRLNSCTLKPRFLELLQDSKPYVIKEIV